MEYHIEPTMLCLRDLQVCLDNLSMELLRELDGLNFGDRRATISDLYIEVKDMTARANMAQSEIVKFSERLQNTE